VSGTPVTETALFGAGCFWGIEEAFRQVEGVVETAVGYAGGATKNPDYRQVCSGTTGHAEVVRIEFDPSRVGYARLLDVFWEIHDPTTLNRQGPDVGSQYRSVIFVQSPEQKTTAESAKAKLDAARRFPRPLVTQIVPDAPFTRAEEYHQRYAEKHGGGSCGL